MVAKRREAEQKRMAVDSLQTQVARMEARLGEYEEEMDEVPQQTIEYAPNP